MIVIFLIVLFSDLFSDSILVDNILCVFFVTFCIVLVISIMVLMYIFNPSEKHSDKLFDKRVKQYKDGKNKWAYYGRIPYCIVDDKLHIEKSNVTYNNHNLDDEFLSLFDAKDEDIVDFESAKQYLKQKLISQNSYMQREKQKSYEKKTGRKKMEDR